MQTKFTTAEGEREWCDGLRALVEQGKLDEAEAVLVDALEGLEGDVAALCRATTRKRVELDGWAELVEAVEMYEGDPITGATLAIVNDADLAFEKGHYHAPEMLLNLYTDEVWSWSAASADDILDQCASDEPAFAGAQEDIETFLEISGLERLNTALLFHKQRFFFREDGPDHAPLRYVDFVVGNWWRALRFHQAVAAELAAMPLPGTVKLVTGLVGMRADAACLHRVTTAAPAVPYSPLAKRPVALPSANDAGPSMGSLADITVARNPFEEEEESVGGQLRRRVAEEAAATPAPEEPKRRMFGRMFARDV
ncbi:hypothetical protein [Alteraurantiacibacter aquimixticola]|uniref:hypothetical protein n=1 Tax=Alteraurantiacibacter aquimixticola TaxID=2489173 RepID=UPI0010A99CB3|nr:hypothetical protein [Alteraurantiacibacter aquimixticola]